MELQQVLNVCFAIIGTLFGWVMKTMWKSIEDMQQNEKDVANRISAIEVLVAGTYVKKDDFTQFSESMFKKLDRIEDKLDHKVDK